MTLYWLILRLVLLQSGLIIPLCRGFCASTPGQIVCSFECASVGGGCQFAEAYKLCEQCGATVAVAQTGTTATTTPTTTTTTTTTPTTTTTTPTTTTTTTTAATTTTASPTAALISKLMAFYDLRQSYTNQAATGPSKYFLTPSSAVTRSASGAAFDGTTSAYIDVDTQSQALLTPMSSSFSFYVRAKRRTYYMATYHYLFDCSSPSSSYYSGLLGDQSGNLMLEHSLAGPHNKLVVVSSQSFGAADNSLVDMSLGVTMSAGAFSSLFGQGNVYTAASTSTQAYTYAPTCLRLGYHGSAGYGLNGNLICYAIANWTMTAAEFSLLHARCGP